MRLLCVCLAALGLQLITRPTAAAPEPGVRSGARPTAGVRLRPPQVKRGRQRLRARCRLLRQQLRCSKAGRACAAGCRIVQSKVRSAVRTLKHTRVGRGVRYRSWQLRGKTTLLLDRVERNLSPRLAHVFHNARNLNPFSLVGFACRKLARDPVFLSAYGAWSLGFASLQLPVMLGLGFGLTAAIGVRAATGLPVDLAVLWWRQHQLRKRADPGATPLGTLRLLGSQHSAFAERRRRRSRRFVKWDAHRKARRPVRPGRPASVRHDNPLRCLATPLLTPPWPG